MNFLEDKPIGMTQHAELLNILLSLYETGGCDPRTLRIVAQSVGIRGYFDKEVGWLIATGKTVTVENPVRLLGE